ncbi:thiamine pyrophosphate-binding protein [Microbacterium sp. NPDC080005]|uniref:thiamine pyrophosphate-binding protein n=1 Tax=Microbacterium sp. NPDC080005 TaxID=3155288 RepID=UPI00344DAFDC
MTGGRTGGDVAVETLRALGVDRVVGIPGQHALGLFDALRRAPIELLPARVENNAGFMADGLARCSATVAPLLLSTGPGALTALPALMEAAGSSVPVLAISAQIPVDGLGGSRRGHLHELEDQSAAFAQVVKGSWTVRTSAQIPSALIEAWELALSVPQGPVLVEIPQDILLAPVGNDVPPVVDARVHPRSPRVRDELIAEAARMLDVAERPVILAGGGAVRAGASDALLRVAEAIDAPVFSTFSGRDAVPTTHPLAAGTWIEDIATTEYLEGADVLLVVGSGLGELSSNYFTLRPQGRVIQLDADLGVLGSNHSGLGLHGDARDALERLSDALGSGSDPRRRTDRVEEIAALADVVRARLDSQGLELERGILASIREGLPDDGDSFWDMTMIAYWAWSAWDSRDGTFATAQGAGGLGYAFPAAIGAAFADPSRAVLAVTGDGGAMYGIAEIATCVQLGLDLTWLIVADGGYGILAEYMTGAFGAATATDLTMPDFVALAQSFGAHAVATTPTTLAADLRTAWETPGPSVIVLPQTIGLFAPTHTERSA